MQSHGPHRSIHFAVMAVMTSTLFAGVAAAAPAVPNPSPPAKVEQRVGVADFKVEYSSPGVKGRTIWGGLVPFDQVWRAGANASTLFHASEDFTFGGVPVAAGTYALFALPGESGWKMILSKKIDGWGAYAHDPADEVARVEAEVATISPQRERLTFLFSDTTAAGTALDLEWADLRVRVPVGVDTSSLVLAEIEQAVKGAWRPHNVSASWLLENDGDLQVALGYADKSIAIQPNWQNHWVKAQILGKQGEKRKAVKAAQDAQRLGKGDRIYENFYAGVIADAIASWK